MAKFQGFWSYVHADDEADEGRIAQLARDVSNQFEMLTGEQVDLFFLDRDAIKWGEAWQSTVDSNLQLVAFFVPVLTPRYFKSPECRRELQFFARKTESLGIKELVLPLLYVDVDELHEDPTQDGLVALIQKFQWTDWRELRFEERTSGLYRRATANLAARFVDANRQSEHSDEITRLIQLTDNVSNVEDNPPGLLDTIAAALDALPVLVEITDTINSDIEIIDTIMSGASNDIHRSDTQAKGIGSRLIIARRVARALVEPVERLRSSGNDLTTRLHEVDLGLRLIIDSAVAVLQEEPELRGPVCEFFSAVQQMSIAAHQGLGSIQGLVDAVESIENVSRDLRPMLRKLRQSLVIMVEARSISDEWPQLIDATGICCDDLSELG